MPLQPILFVLPSCLKNIHAPLHPVPKSVLHGITSWCIDAGQSGLVPICRAAIPVQAGAGWIRISYMSMCDKLSQITCISAHLFHTLTCMKFRIARRCPGFPQAARFRAVPCAIAWEWTSPDALHTCANSGNPLFPRFVAPALSELRRSRKTLFCEEPGNLCRDLN